MVVSARDESLRLPATLDALRAAFPGARLVLGDDGSRDATAQLARAGGAEVIAGGRRGKGETASRACARALQLGGPGAVYVLCDADLGASAGLLVALRDVVAAGEAEIAIGAFERRSNAGFGLAIGFARWAVRRATGRQLSAPISGQRALSAAALAASLPFAHGFGMELAMTIDALRRGDRIVEIPLELEHRQTGRSPAGFRHRARQLLDFALVYAKGH